MYRAPVDEQRRHCRRFLVLGAVVGSDPFAPAATIDSKPGSDEPRLHLHLQTRRDLRLRLAGLDRREHRLERASWIRTALRIKASPTRP